MDTKTWTGRVAVGSGGVWIGQHSHRGELGKLWRQVCAVRDALLATGLREIPVRGVLCLANENDGCLPDELTEIETLRVGHPEPVVAFATAGGPCDAATIDRVVVALRRAFRVDGGGVAPPPVALPAAAPLPERRRLARWRWPLAGAAAVAAAAVLHLELATPPAPSGTGSRSAVERAEAVGRDVGERLGSRHERSRHHPLDRRRPAP